MVVERFRMCHLPMIRDNIKARDLDESLIKYLPRTGFVAIERGEFIACGFLRECEGDVGIADSFMTNASAPADMRDTAMDMVLEAVIGEAKHLGFNSLIGFSLDKNTLVRCQKHGFEQQPHTVTVLAAT